MTLPYLSRLAVLALIRSWRATLVLSLMIVVAVAALVVIIGLGVGTNDAMIRNSTGLYSGHITVGNLHQEGIAVLRELSGVNALFRRHLPVVLTAAGRFETVTLIGIDPARETAVNVFWKKLVAGSFPGKDAKGLLLSRDIAARLHTNPGDDIQIKVDTGSGLQTAKIVGIYQTGLSQLDQGLAFCSQEMLPRTQKSVTAALFLDSPDQVRVLTERLRELLPEATVMPWYEFMPDLQQLIDLNNVCMTLVLVLVFAIVAVGISCSFLVFSLKNIREYGLLQAMGVQVAETAFFLLLQIVLLTVFAALVGTIIGSMVVLVLAASGLDVSSFTNHNQYFAVSGILYPHLTPMSLLAPPAAAIFFGIVAAIWPVLHLLGRHPAQILRSL